LIFEKHGSVISAEKTIELYPELKGSVSNMLDGKQARMTFNNGREISVIFGKMFYSDGISTYEAWEIGGDDEDPRGYLTKDQVTEYMKEIQSKGKR
jgi:hypothetical protein